jgi:hypothetical protein
VPVRALSINGELALILGVLVALESLQVVPARAVLFRRIGIGPWRAADATDRRRLLFVAPGAPLLMGLVATDAHGGEATRSETRATALPTLRSRLARLRWATRFLRVSGALQVVLLVLGVPVAVSSHGAIGLGAAVAACLVLGAVSCAVATRAWRRVVDPRRPRIGRLLRWCWPFSAPGAAQDILQESLRGAPVVAVAHALLEPERFRAWVRPLAYDHLAGEPVPGLREIMSDGELGELVARAPASDDTSAVSHCPRCGALYAVAAGTCARCAIPLSAH